MAAEDRWDGAVYLNKPGVREAAEINGRTIKRALVEAGIPESRFSSLDVLEVGAGVGTVTRHLTGFKSVHSIEPSRSMISVLSKQVEGLENVTWAMHEFGPTSAAQFDRAEPMPSPIESEPDRMLAPPRARFDVAVATLVAHHVGTLKPFFEGVLSVLKPGGLFVLIEFRHGEDGEDISKVFHVKEEPKNEPVDDWDQGVSIEPRDVFKGRSCLGSGAATEVENQVETKDGRGSVLKEDMLTPQVISGNQFRTTPTKAQLGGLLKKYGFTGIGDMDGEGVPAFRLERGPVPTLVVWGRRPE